MNMYVPTRMEDELERRTTNVYVKGWVGTKEEMNIYVLGWRDGLGWWKG
jgi:hypothetical protein